MIKGLEKTTLIDYPGKVASIIFTGGCSFKCPFCQNPSLVLKHKDMETIEQEDIIEFMKSRKKWLDGAVITGGEPTIHNELPAFIEKIKKETSLLVKLDTNGTNPEMLKELAEKKLIDYIAMDIKAPLEKKDYEKAAGVNVDMEKISESIDIIRKSGIDYEFRTTVVPGIIDKKSIEKIGKALSKSKKYALQQFRNKDLIDPEMEKKEPYPKEKIEEMKKVAEKYFDAVEVRGI